jgi:class 3 adenylate cyclase
LVRSREWLGAEGRSESVFSLAERDWELATETFAHATFGWSDDRQSHQWAHFIRRSTDPADFARIGQATSSVDCSALLSQIAAPTLVLDNPEYIDARGQGALLASSLPNAQLVRLGRGPLAVYEHEEGMRLVEEFLDIRVPAAPELPSGTAIILFADIVDSTALTERLGDAAFRAKARGLDGALRAVIRENAGTPIEGKLLGDGVLAVFTSVRQAIEAALACGAAGSHAGLPLHLGLHAGDVIRESDPDGRSNVYGGAVNIASRIAGLSAPGEVLVWDTVRGLARTSAGVTFEDRGERELKGVGEPCGCGPCDPRGDAQRRLRRERGDIERGVERVHEPHTLNNSSIIEILRHQIRDASLFGYRPDERVPERHRILLACAHAF